MFPWLAFGHIIPFLELAKLIAQRGHKISFISTPRNIQRLPSIPPNLTPRINLSSSPDWIIFDFAPYWLPEIATKLGISGVFFSIFGAWTISFAGPSYSAMLTGDDPRTEPQHFTVPPKWVTFPSKVAFRIHEAKRFFDHIEVNSSGVSDSFRMGSVLAGCDVIAIRSCSELEADFLRLVEDLHCKPVIPVRLLPPPAQFSEGGVDEKVFEEKKVGIEVPRDEQDGSFTRNSVAESLRLVIVDKEGSAYRENAKQQMATLFGDETISDRCMDQFVAFLRSHRKLPAVIDNDLPTHAPN
ncbi:UDP-rhamnose:rhamnosyltransferase 1 [Populus alba x Populus x berolinensis]|nr:UDP-rhamnose:rhamnosyltransferase 1 [Populus alba x Populus x berolinensis]